MHKIQHITEKELDLLNYFYEKKRGHVRQIKRAVQLSEHTLLKCLNSLEKRKLVSSQKEGNLKIYEVNPQNTLVKVFYSYFDADRLDALEFKRRKAVTMFVEGIKKTKIPYFILLFGSTAKGDYTPKSDIDLIIAYDSIEKSLNERINELKKVILAETGLKISSIAMELGEFLKEKENKQNYALQDAIISGYPAFGNQLYYEVMFG